MKQHLIQRGKYRQGFKFERIQKTSPKLKVAKGEQLQKNLEPDLHMEEQDKYYPKSQEQPLKIYLLLPNKSHKYDTSC